MPLLQANEPMRAEGLRKSDRVSLRLPIEASWFSPAGLAVTQPAQTLLVSRHGGRLVVQFECGAAAFTCVATAFNRLSLVKGLVRY